MPESLLVRPSEVYEKVCEIAFKRYGHVFPAEQRACPLLSTSSRKFALLRELSRRAFGIVLEAQEYFLENEQNYGVAAVPHYSWLPFQPHHVLEFAPLVKTIKHRNTEVEGLMAKAVEVQRQGRWERAFELYSLCVTIFI